MLSKLVNFKYSVSFFAASALAAISVFSTEITTNSWLIVYSEDAPEELLK